MSDFIDLDIQGPMQDLNLGGEKQWPGLGIEGLFKLPNPWPHYGWWRRNCRFLEVLKGSISEDLGRNKNGFF